MVDLLNKAKNILGGNSPGTGPVVEPDNRIDRIDNCRVVWYQWANELGTVADTVFNIQSIVSNSAPDSELAKARSYDISNHIESFAYTKGMSGAAGSFQIILENSFDWSKYMRPGQWISVYLAGDGSLPLPKEVPDQNAAGGLIASGVSAALSSAFGLSPTPKLPLPEGPPSSETIATGDRLRCLGLIQRVGIRSQTSVDGAVNITYVITGKDYGTIYEETELWFNANDADGEAFEKAIQGISTKFTKNLTALLDQYHSIFLNPADTLATDITSITSFFPRQWVMPDRLVVDLGLEMKPGTGAFFGSIAGLTEFNATVFENPMPNPFAGLQGRCWEKLKSVSQPEYHELFTELSDLGYPKIIFRPIPWATDKSRYPVSGKFMLTYKDLSSKDPVPPPLPVGTLASVFSSAEALETAVKAAVGAFTGPNIRTKHSISLNATAVESFDIGPDYHDRANFFLVDAMTSMQDQNNAWALMSKSPIPPFPFRDENDIKRHGFKPLFVNVHSFLVSNQQLFASEAQKEFMLELNQILRDYYSNAEDLYSGSFVLGCGLNSVKLGKVLVTDDSFEAIGNMVFYIEAYTDNFNVNVDGTGVWTQTVSVTRGTELSALDKKSTKDKKPTKISTFHTNAGG